MRFEGRQPFNQHIMPGRPDLLRKAVGIIEEHDAEFGIAFDEEEDS